MLYYAYTQLSLIYEYLDVDLLVFTKAPTFDQILLHFRNVFGEDSLKLRRMPPQVANSQSHDNRLRFVALSNGLPDDLSFPYFCLPKVCLAYDLS